MKLPRLFPFALLLSAFALAACGNKADLFMPPPPEPAEVPDPWDGEDPFDDEAVDDGAADGAPAPDPFEDAPALPVPVPTGDE